MKGERKMSNKRLIILAIPILTCILFTVFHGIDMNLSEQITERHRVVSVLDDGRYLMEKPDGELYISDALQDVEPGNYIVILIITSGSTLNIFLYIMLGLGSVVSLLALLALALDK